MILRREDTLIISLNGSILFEALEKVKLLKLAKVIPSVTAEINRSQTLVTYNSLVTNNDKEMLRDLLSCIGSIIELPESEMGMGSELNKIKEKIYLYRDCEARNRLIRDYNSYVTYLKEIGLIKKEELPDYVEVLNEYTKAYEEGSAKAVKEATVTKANAGNKKLINIHKKLFSS